MTDAGWVDVERQIGTTGAVVDPDLYVAVGISGALQHVSGLGHPRDVVAVNLDPSCPMMALADLAIVTDAPAFVAALERRLSGVVGGDRWLSRSTSSWSAPGRRGRPPRSPRRRGGRSVCLLERGPFPGSKNMYGGVTYPSVLDELLPGWWEEFPVQRWITRRSTMVATPTQSVTLDVRAEDWGRPPYNGATTLRSELDPWLADKAVDAGAVLVTSTTATGLLRGPAGSGGRRAHRPPRRRHLGARW